MAASPLIARSVWSRATLRWVFVFACSATIILIVTHAGAVPSFSRKYATSCQTCHTHYPVLSPFGEAFRRNGYRFPTQDAGVDSDVAKEEPLELGQPEDRNAFPKSVWPGRISEYLPLSMLVNASLPYALPESGLKRVTSNAFDWSGVAGPLLVYAAGSFSDRITYYAKLAVTTTGTSLGPAYLLFNDIVGPRHLVNVYVGRLLAPQLTSHLASGAYLAEKAFPLISVAGLFNGNHSFVLGQGPANGIELSGIGWHRLAYSAGWLASSAQTGLATPTSQDFYAHLGTKFGGMSLDGESARDSVSTNVERPWAETAITLDVFAYRGLMVADNYTNYPALTAQRNVVEAVGAATRLQLGSFSANVIVQYQNHFRPYAGTDPRPANPPDQPVELPGTPDNTGGQGLVASSELAYVVYPWLVPAIRTEHTALRSDWGSGNFTRFLPGFSCLFRSNIRLYLYADMQRAVRLPPQAPGYAGSWAGASGSAEPPTARGRRSSVEAIMARLSWGF